MSQLDLFQEPEQEPKPIVYITPDHHKANGYIIKNIKKIPLFRLKIERFLLSSINESITAKRLLFTFNSETKEYDHKPINNFRINQLLHWIYDSLSEGGNYV